jgi:hypothetical protein
MLPPLCILFQSYDACPRALFMPVQIWLVRLDSYIEGGVLVPNGMVLGRALGDLRCTHLSTHACDPWVCLARMVDIVLVALI